MQHQLVAVVPLFLFRLLNRMTLITSWNVNSIKARLPIVVEWLKSFNPDVVFFQEIKCVKEAFPYSQFEDLGYNVEVEGQKSYNGVAILSKFPIEVELSSLPGDESDVQARYIEAFIKDFRIASIYLPNGNPTRTIEGYDHEKFTYKLSWMQRLIERTKRLLASEEAFILGGDYNLCPTDGDCYDPKAFEDDALCRSESRSKFREMLHLGLTDAIANFEPRPHQYTYWGYQGGAWNRDNGLRIDHFLLSPQAADRLKESGIDKIPRSKAKTSDHTPIWFIID